MSDLKKQSSASSNVTSSPVSTSNGANDAGAAKTDTVMTLQGVPDEVPPKKQSGPVGKIGASLVPPILALIGTGFLGSVVYIVVARLPGPPEQMLTLSTRDLFVGSLSILAFTVTGALAAAKAIQQRVEGWVTAWLKDYSVAHLASIPVFVLTVIGTIISLVANRLIAGIVLTLFGLFRMALHVTRRQFHVAGAKIKTHVKSEIVFHCVSMACLAGGVCLILSSIPQSDFKFPQRAAMIATVLLAAGVAINKASTRGRKVCTQMFQAIESVERAYDQIGQADPAKMSDKREQFIGELAPLDRALRTRLNSGYAVFGSFILQPTERAELVGKLLALVGADDGGRVAGDGVPGADSGEVPGEEVRETNGGRVAGDGVPGADSGEVPGEEVRETNGGAAPIDWSQTEPELRKLAEACEPWVDVSA